jgi:DNA replication ATP-dependent helicase Dna2
VNLRGTILDVGEVRSVSTQYGERDVAEVTVRPPDDSPTTVTLWGKWTHTADHAAAGMDLLVTEASSDGDGYATTGDSYVVLEPDFLVDVTDIRSWVQCPRLHYLNKLSGVPLAYPVVKGTIVHEVFGDLLRGRDLEESVADRVEAAGLELGLLGREAAEVRDEVRRNAAAIDGWLRQGTLTETDEWRSEYSLISPTFGIKGRADALRRGMPVELKTYALLLAEEETEGPGVGDPPDTATLLYTKNAALDRSEATGDLSPAKEFSVGRGLLEFVVRTRNELAATAAERRIPTGYEADARCDYCFEQDTCMVVSGRLDQESKAGQVGDPLPATERDAFERFYRAIEDERRAVHDEYRKLWEQTATERADDDRALIDLEPLDSRELADGDWELRATVPDGAVSKLRAGDVALASDGDPVGGDAELGRIRRLDDEVVVTVDEPLDLRRLDVYPSELSVDRQLTALHDALLKGDPDRKAVVFGDADPTFRDVSGTFVDNNDAQDAAVRRALGADDFALVHGPPGTGKTYTIARLVRALVDRGERVLLSAFTNRAVDNALDALRDQGFEGAVRVGTQTGVREDMLDVRLQRRGDPNERAARLRNAPVVAATTATCGSRVLREDEFDVAVVDEASQLTEPGTLAATNLAERFVLVGDHHQLPPVVQSGNETLERSLFERLHDAHPEAAVMLDRQYRMSQRIQAFASREFYDGALRPATPEVAGRSVADLPGVDAATLPDDLRAGVRFLDPDGRREGNANPVEADAVAAVVDDYLAAGVDPEDVVVIAPFRAQVAELARRVDVAVDTVDRFQGSSAEVVVVSFVATDDLSGPIFEDPRRVNVALTRAKRALVLVGDADALASDPFYARMLDWARR